MVLPGVPGRRGYVPASAGWPDRLRDGGLPGWVPGGGWRRRGAQKVGAARDGGLPRPPGVRGEGGLAGDEGAGELEPPLQVPEEAGPRRAVHAARGCRSRRSRRGSPRAGCGPRAAGHPGWRHRERVRGLGQLRDGGDRRQRPEAARVDVVHQLQRRGSEEPDGGDQEHGVARRLCGVPGGSQVFKLLRRVRDQERAVRPRASPGGTE